MRKLLFIASTLILISLLIFWLLPKSNPHLSQYLDPDYAKHVELQAYIMTPEQVATLFATNLNDNPEHWTVDDAPKDDSQMPWAMRGTYLDPLYLVIRIKNTGPKYIWGKLLCELPAGGTTQIDTLCLKPNEDQFQNLIRRVYSGGISYKMLSNKDLVVKWDPIYSNFREQDS